MNVSGRRFNVSIRPDGPDYDGGMSRWGSLWIVISLLACSAAWVAAGRTAQSLHIDGLDAQIAASDGINDIEALPDAAWRRLDLQELARMTGPYWIRLQVELEPQPGPSTSLALRLSLRAASELYWNDRLIGSNGQVGNSTDTEIPGQIDWVVILPTESIQPGRHGVLLHASSFRQGFQPSLAEFRIQIGPAEQLHRPVVAPWLLAAFAMGAVAVAGLYFLATLAASGGQARLAAWLLIGLGLVGILLPLAEGWRPLLGYSYDLHVHRLRLLLILTICAASLLPAYLQARFGDGGFGWPWRVYAGLVVLIVVAMPGFDGRSLSLHLLGLTTSLFIMLRARSAEPGDRLPILALLLTIIVLLLANPVAFLDGLYFIALAVLMSFLLLRHAGSLAEVGRKLAELQAQRARLRTQLLQRSIHPHWLMNTLTSLQELIEQSPAEASHMLELLAEQFDRMRTIGERPLIALAEEIALCRSHLDIVGAAHGQKIPFDMESPAGHDAHEFELPPGILHALVENALTHAGVAACADAGFRLSVSRNPDRLLLEFHAARGRQPGPAGPEGTGSRFIRASLETSFGGQASFSHAPQGERWISRIEMPCAS